MTAQKKKPSASQKRGKTKNKPKLSLNLVAARLAGGGKAVFHRLARLPRPLQVAAIYLLTVLVVVGVFVWRISNMQIEYPYTSENTPQKFEPLWGDFEAESETVTRQEEPQELQLEEHQGPEWLEQMPAQAPVQPTVEEAAPAFAATWPVQGELLYGFHDLTWQVTIPPYSSYRYSKGVAIKTVPGAEVIAVEGGAVSRVVKIDYPGGGASVTIRHLNGMESYYGNLTDLQVAEGSSVSRRQVLGKVSSSATEEPAYLYLEIRENRTPVDPLLYLASGG